MTFTDVLREENEDIFEMIFDHPFVQVKENFHIKQWNTMLKLISNI
ncbi:hypothetical protein [Oceanobacillus saliphilus]|nr:hypothetical protein [Oceanobacillus saliphilus]